MNTDEAIKVLGVSESAGFEERLEAFEGKRKELEQRMARVPTDALRSKYRQSLKRVEEAYELLESADHEDLLSAAPEAPRPSTQPSEPEERHPEKAAASESIAPKAKPSDGTGKEKLILGAVVLLMLVGGGIWWQVSERNRQAAEAETARIAAAEATEVEHLAAEKAEEARRLAEEEAAREAERLRKEQEIARQRNALELELEGLEARLRQEERKLSDLKSAERESARNGEALRQGYDRVRRARQEDFVSWLSDYESRHPLKLAANTAEELSRSGNLDGALAALDDGESAAESLGEEVASSQYERYFGPLVSWMLDQDAKESVAGWLRVDEPEALEEHGSRIRMELAYLDEGDPGRTGVLAKLEDLAFLAGEADGDYVRWLDQVLPDLMIDSEVDGTVIDLVVEGSDQIVRAKEVFGDGTAISEVARDEPGSPRNGKKFLELGEAPLSLKDLPPGKWSFRAMAEQHEADELLYESSLNAQDARLVADPVPWGFMELTTKPEGAKVILDGEAIGTTPLKRTFAPGEVAVFLEKEGFQPESLEFKSELGGWQSVQVELRPHAKVVFASNPEEAEVELVFLTQSRKLGVTPFEIGLAPGFYEVAIRKNGYLPEGRFIRIGGDDMRVMVTLEKRVGSLETYLIREGDTLARIASKFGVSLSEILTANPYLDPRRLRVGQEIIIPEG